MRHARSEGTITPPPPQKRRALVDMEFFFADAPAILEIIQLLADYEHESDAVKATVETLRDTIAFAPSSSTGANTSSVPDTEPTSPQKPARCLLLFAGDGDQDEKPAGMALYFYNYSTWRSRPGIYLEDLFVRPEARGRGFGKRLLVELAREVVAMRGTRLEWSVLKWNEPSIKFYESIGAQAMNDWVGMRVDNEGLDKLAHLLD